MQRHHTTLIFTILIFYIRQWETNFLPCLYNWKAAYLLKLTLSLTFNYIAKQIYAQNKTNHKASPCIHNVASVFMACAQRFLHFQQKKINSIVFKLKSYSFSERKYVLGAINSRLLLVQTNAYGIGSDSVAESYPPITDIYGWTLAGRI